MKSWLFVGAKVVCVDDSAKFCNRPGGVDWERCRDGLTKDCIYTVREVEVQPWGTIGVKLVEIVRAIGPGDNCEIGYNADRFAPVTVINTDAAITAMRELMQRAVKTKEIENVQ